MNSAKKLAFPFLALATFAFVSAIPASASSIAWSAPGDVTPVTDFNLVGDVFTANSNQTVSSVGIYILPYTSTEDVGLFNSSGTELAVVNVNPISATQSDGYYWQSIGGVNLTAGQQYTLVVFTNDSNPGYGTSNTNPTSGWATFNYGVTGTAVAGVTFPDSMTLPTLTQTTTGFYGANLLASPTPTPEPESLLLLGSGLVGLAGFVRFKLHKN